MGHTLIYMKFLDNVYLSMWEYSRIFYGILSFPHDNVMNMDNVMKNYIRNIRRLIHAHRLIARLDDGYQQIHL